MTIHSQHSGAEDYGLRRAIALRVIQGFALRKHLFRQQRGANMRKAQESNSVLFEVELGTAGGDGGMVKLLFLQIFQRLRGRGGPVNSPAYPRATGPGPPRTNCSV